jgi:hypothetical protein
LPRSSAQASCLLVTNGTTSAKQTVTKVHVVAVSYGVATLIWFKHMFNIGLTPWAVNSEGWVRPPQNST